MNILTKSLIAAGIVIVAVGIITISNDDNTQANDWKQNTTQTENDWNSKQVGNDSVEWNKN